jgi:hypothetical protein
MPGDIEESTDGCPVTGRTLVAPPAIVAELRLGLLDGYLRSVADELSAIVDELENDLGSGDMPCLSGKRVRLRTMTLAVETRLTLYETVGFPGQPLTEKILDGRATCALAVGVLTSQRGTYVARLAQNKVPERERRQALDTVRLLSEFLRTASSAANQSPRNAYGC